MQYDKENMMTIISFLACILREKREKKLTRIYRRCMKSMEMYIERHLTDIQFFLSYLFTECGIAYFQMDGIRNRSNYMTFLDTVRERPVLFVIRDETLGRVLKNEKSAGGNENGMVWLEQKREKTYILHRGKESEEITQGKLMQIYLLEKKNMNSQYFMGAVIRMSPQGRKMVQR